MDNKELNLEPFKKLLVVEIEPEYLADKLTEMLVAHMRISLFVVNADIDNHVYIHENNDDHIYLLQKLIDTLMETAKINKQSKN